MVSKEEYRCIALFDAPANLTASGSHGPGGPLEPYFSQLQVPRDCVLVDYEETRRFLMRYCDEPNTAARYRTEIQPFLLYLWTVESKTLCQVDVRLIERYLEFRKNPPREWISDRIQPAFLNSVNGRIPNRSWRPFVLRRTTSKEGYVLSQESFNSAHRVLNRYFTWLSVHGHVSGNPLCTFNRPSLSAWPGVRKTPSDNEQLSDREWVYLLRSLISLANTNSSYERILFLIVTLKYLCLAFSDVARGPRFCDFRFKTVAGVGQWFFALTDDAGRGRLIGVPDTYLFFLERWRRHIQMNTPLPKPKESLPILPSRKGGGLGYRQICRDVEKAFELMAQNLRAEGREAEAIRIERIKGHTRILRNTGANQALRDGGTLAEISQNLGHKNVEYTASRFSKFDVA